MTRFTNADGPPALGNSWGDGSLPNVANFVNSFLLAVVLIECLRRLPIPLPVARPTERRDHIGLVPLIGGLGMFMAFFLALVLVNLPLTGQLYLISGLFMLVAVGVIDDFFDIRPLFKLIAQSASAALMIIPYGRVLDIGQLFGVAGWHVDLLEVSVALFFVVGMINAINMIDGVDGLAGGIVAAILLWLTMIAYALGRPTELAIILLLLSATIGFLAFNIRTPWRARATVFMGDAGSMMLGACVAYFTIMLVSDPSPGSSSTERASLPALCWLMSVPAIDTLSLCARRFLAGKSPFAADRWHLHHLLLAAGLSPVQVTTLLVGASLLLGGVGFAGVALNVPVAIMTVGLLLPIAAHTALVYRMSSPGAALQRADARPNAAGVR